jgi:FixJ family two-component response regulator
MMMSVLVAIIDDDQAILSGLSNLMRAVGNQVRLYASAEAFLADERTPSPDCVLTDIQMPGMNGLELQLELRRLHSDVPIIVMTAYPEPEIRDRALRLGARNFLRKPFEADVVLRALTDAVGS